MSHPFSILTDIILRITPYIPQFKISGRHYIEKTRLISIESQPKKIVIVVVVVIGVIIVVHIVVFFIPVVDPRNIPLKFG